MKQTEKHSKIKRGDVCMVGVSLAFRDCSSSHACMASAHGDGKCLLYLELFPFSWKQLVLLESCFFCSTSPNEKFPLTRVHQHCIASKVMSELSAAGGPRNMLFLLSLLFSPGLAALALFPHHEQCSVHSLCLAVLSTLDIWPRVHVPCCIPCECSS